MRLTGIMLRLKAIWKRIKPVLEVIVLVGDLLLLIDYLTGGAMLPYFKSLSGYAQVFYYVLLIVAIISMIVILFWFGRRYERRLLKKKTIASLPIKEKTSEATKPVMVDFNKFDRLFEAVQQEPDSDIKRQLLFEFQDELNYLCNKCDWSIMEHKIKGVLECIIPDKLSEDTHEKKYVQFLAMIISCYNLYVKQTIAKKWLGELTKIYNAQNAQKHHASDFPYVLMILQKLHGNSADYVEQLIEDATKSSNLGFSMYAGNIDFAGLKNKDMTGYNNVLSYLIRKMREAKQKNDDELLERLRSLYDLAKR